MFHCHLCTSKHTLYRSYLDHIRTCHGVAYIPWTCSICYKYDHCNSPCFPSSQELIRHWRRNHPEITEAKDIVHPVYGNHYSFLPVQHMFVPKKAYNKKVYNKPNL